MRVKPFGSPLRNLRFERQFLNGFAASILARGLQGNPFMNLTTRNGQAKASAGVGCGAKVRAALVLGDVVGNPTTEQRSGTISGAANSAGAMDNLPLVIVDGIGFECTCSIGRSGETVRGLLSEVEADAHAEAFRVAARGLARISHLWTGKGY